jgi:hypothetical protein
MVNNPLSVPVASIISYASKKIMSLRQVAYKYGVVGQKTTAAFVRSQASQVARNLTDGGKKSLNIADAAQ